MTDRDSDSLGDADDLLAADYVLGTLDAADWRAAHDRAAVDGAFAARVRAWEGRLAPLNDGFAPVPPPPQAWAGIEARLFPAPARPRRRLWLPGLIMAGALAAGMAVVVTPGLLSGPVAPAALTARLATADGALVFAAAYDATAGRVTLRRTQGAAPAAGQDHELWAIDASGTPRSLGLVSAALTALDATLAPGTVLAVSLEPAGGSPQPAPTGPVLAAAPLVSL